MVYDIDEKLVKKELSKLTPLNYNKFFWWRKYATPHKTLPKKSPLLNKIKNGDFELSPYYWMAKQAEMEINSIHDKFGAKDPSMFFIESKMVCARRNRLWMDFEKDEMEKMKNLEEEFIKTFKITKEEFQNYIESFDGSILELYNSIEKLN